MEDLELKYFPVDVCRRTEKYPFVQWGTYNVHIKHQKELNTLLSGENPRDELAFIAWCQEYDVDLVKITRTVIRA